MKKIVLILLSLSFLSCATGKIVRWTEKSDEQKSRSLEAVENDSIFADFLWTTPPVSSRKIGSDFEYKGKQYSLEEVNGKLRIQRNGTSYTFDVKESDKVYPDTGYLEPVTKLVSHWVPKTTTMPETVPVTKTRSVPVTTTGPNGAMSTTYRTETYTDFETHFVTRTEWVWETETEYSYRIPSSEYYEVEVDDSGLFYIYAVNGEYYIQNPSYLMCKEMNESFWGEKEVNILFIDSNANGTFLESEDHVLFNTWNPYDPKDSYKEISYLMDNRWYYSDVLKEDLFLDFSYGYEGRIDISYLNEQFIGNENWGSLTVTGIQDLDTHIYINGKKYRIKDRKPVKSEYGNFNMEILLDNHLDFSRSYTIDERNPDEIVDYQITEDATLLEIKNIFSNNYFVTVRNGEYSKTYYNVKKVNIPLGENSIEISVNGFVLPKTINTNHPEKVEIDFEKEIKQF